MKIKKLLIILILSLLFTVIFLFAIWANHMFVNGLNPFIGSIFILLALLLTVLIFITVIRKISIFLKGKITFTPAILFAMGFFSFLISGFLSEALLGKSTLDIHLHDTLFIIAHWHIVILIALLFGTFAAIYYWYPKLFRRFMNEQMGYIHFWITIIGAYLIFFPMHYEGLAGMPSRYIDYSGWTNFNQFEQLNIFISKAAIIFLAAQLLFVFNLLYSAFNEKKINAKNLKKLS